MAIVGREIYLEQVRLNFAIYCDEKNLSKDERQELSREIGEELEWEADIYEPLEWIMTKLETSVLMNRTIPNRIPRMHAI